MPNCPDPSTSSEKIWYTEAISYIEIYTLLLSCFAAPTLRLFSMLILVVGKSYIIENPRKNVAFAKHFWYDQIFIHINIYNFYPKREVELK